MSKRINSKISNWSGSVTIADPLNIPQAKLIEAGITIAQDAVSNANGGMVWGTVTDEARLPAIFACVEKWELDNFPEHVTIDTFPASPRKASRELIAWIFSEMIAVYRGEAELPNE